MRLLPALCDWARPIAVPAQRVAIIGRTFRRWLKDRKKLIALLAVSLIVTAAVRLSWLGPRLLSAVASKFNYTVGSGASATTWYPRSGPYDLRLGHSGIPAFTERLLSQSYRIDEQARDSRALLFGTRLGIYPIYHEKTSAGLDIFDRQGASLYSFRDPRHIYPNFESIPPLVVRTLLFVENRHLLNESDPTANPAIEWGRLGRAAFDYGVHQFNRRHPVSGGSTLATQLEKLRHSPEGRTHSPAEKFRQVASATLRSYQDGPRTLRAQREIICNYINSIPLSATAAHGEVVGLGDGLTAWYGVDFAKVNKLLGSEENSLSPQEIDEWGRAYRQVLSLFLALRRPSTELARPASALNAQTDRYLQALSKAGVISNLLRDAALRNWSQIKPANTASSELTFVARKSADAVRVQLLKLLQVRSNYSLDRLDLEVKTTIDETVQQSVTNFLVQLADPKNARNAGLNGDRMLSVGDPGRVIYSVSLYERGDGVNLLRAQTDTFNQPLSVVDGTRMQLGSTAKLRTLINYLQIIEELHREFSGLTPAQLSTKTSPAGDRLTSWALEYLSGANDRDVKVMLNAALDRKYSASPGEVFFTAGGRHVFANFERTENAHIVTVREAFEHSVNLAFIRLMRDIENYYKSRLPGVSPALLSDPSHPAREGYLRRFADDEGAVFLRRFYSRYRGLSTDQALDKLIQIRHRTPVRIAVIFRSCHPTADFDTFSRFMKQHVPQSRWGNRSIEQLYKDYAPGRFSLNDRGYLAGLHPLELWLIGYLAQYPEATFSQVLAASAQERQDVYRWLFRPKMRRGQDVRIGTILEQDAFHEIWKAWRRLGYPFDSLTPSYATAIGVSGDTPKALAELAGVIANGGTRLPLETIRELRFARHTPMETSFGFHPPAGERVISREIAELVKEEMLGVVKNGTGRRAYRALVLPGGHVVSVAGKTGTGDNRFKVYAKGNALVADRPVDRTAAFVFILDDRLFGTVMAFVPGQSASSYKFTSSLAVQVLKDLAPALQPLLSHFPEPEGNVRTKPVQMSSVAFHNADGVEPAIAANESHLLRGNMSVAKSLPIADVAQYWAAEAVPPMISDNSREALIFSRFGSRKSALASYRRCPFQRVIPITASTNALRITFDSCF